MNDQFFSYKIDAQNDNAIILIREISESRLANIGCQKLQIDNDVWSSQILSQNKNN